MAVNLTILEQVRRNAVALISLVVALTSLGYNTWRNERTEANRNIREAGFILMTELGELQQLLFLARYDNDHQRGNPRVGWTHVLTIRDLSYSMPGPVRLAADDLHVTWQRNWESIDTESGFAQIDTAIDTAKTEILEAIRSLD